MTRTALAPLSPPPLTPAPRITHSVFTTGTIDVLRLPKRKQGVRRGPESQLWALPHCTDPHASSSSLALSFLACRQAPSLDQALGARSLNLASGATDIPPSEPSAPCPPLRRPSPTPLLPSARRAGWGLGPPLRGLRALPGSGGREASGGRALAPRNNPQGLSPVPPRPLCPSKCPVQANCI